MAPRLTLHSQPTSLRSPCLSNRHHPYGQAQTDMGPLDRLRRLRCSHRLHRCVRYWEENAAEAVLQADHEARSAEGAEYGGYDEEVGRRRDIEEGGQWHVAEEQAEEAQVGKIEG